MLDRIVSHPSRVWRLQLRGQENLYATCFQCVERYSVPLSEGMSRAVQSGKGLSTTCLVGVGLAILRLILALACPLCLQLNRLETDKGDIISFQMIGLSKENIRVSKMD